MYICLNCIYLYLNVYCQCFMLTVCTKGLRVTQFQFSVCMYCTCGRIDNKADLTWLDLWGLSSKIDSRIWVNFTRNGLRLGSRHQEPPHTDVSRNLATVVVFLLLSHSWTTDNVRGVLPGLRRRTGLLLSGPKSSFQMRASFVFHLETKVLESGGRVEKLIAQVAWSPVLSFHSLWWFGVQCHLLVLVHCVFFLKTNVTAPVYQEILEHFMLPSADQLFKDADFIFQQDLAPAHTTESTKSWLNDYGVVCLTGQQNHQTWTHRESMGYCQEENEKQETSWRPLSKKPGLPYHLSSATNWSPPCHAELRQ